MLDTQAGLPPGVTQSPLPPEHFPVPLAFTDPDNADVLWIGSWGSSSCPSIPATYSISAHGVLTLTLEPDQEKIIPAPAQVPCTADRALTSTAIAVPDGVENPNEVIIREYTDISTPVHPYPEK